MQSAGRIEFERKVLIRQIFIPKKMENGQLQTLRNKKVNEILEEEEEEEEEDVDSRKHQSSKLQWYGHIQTMDENRIVKKIMEGKPDGGKRRVKTKSRWDDQVLNDLTRIRVRGWRNEILILLNNNNNYFSQK